MVNDNISNTDKLKSAICYIPLVWIVIYFIEKDKSAYLMKHIKYSSFLLITLVLIRLVFIALYISYFGGLFILVYIALSIYLWLKAYNWEWVEIEVIDKFYSSNFKEKSNTTTEKKVQKEEQFDDNDWESVVKTGNLVIDKIANWVTNVVKDLKKDKKDDFIEEDNKENDKKDKKDDDILDF